MPLESEEIFLSLMELYFLLYLCHSVQTQNQTRTLKIRNHLNSGTIYTGSGQRAVYNLPHWPRTDAPVQDPDYHGYTAEKRAWER